MKQEYRHLSINQVRDIINNKHDKEYLLVDVRQPDEYKKAHISGAILVPLNHLEEQIPNLPPEKNLVFYCHSGRRSRAAAALAGSSDYFSSEHIYNMNGGMLGWDGLTLPGVPALKAYDFSGSLTELLLQAMELERGADRFYSRLLQRIQQDEVLKKVETLARAEEAHARLLYNAIPGKEEMFADFHSVYEQLPGQIVEGGKNIDVLLEFVDTCEDTVCRCALELALVIECTAYDMYRNMAEYCADDVLSSLFTDIAQAEKEHITVAAEALALCSA